MLLIFGQKGIPLFPSIVAFKMQNNVESAFYFHPPIQKGIVDIFNGFFTSLKFRRGAL